MKAHDALPPIAHDRPPGRWARWCSEAEKSPGTWFEVGIYHRTMVTHLRAGRISGVDPDRFEFASRKDPDETRPYYARIFLRAKS